MWATLYAYAVDLLEINMQMGNRIAHITLLNTQFLLTIIDNERNDLIRNICILIIPELKHSVALI